VIRPAEISDPSVIQGTRELGKRVNQIYTWKQQLKAKDDNSFPGKCKWLGAFAKLAELHEENERLCMENDFLKKSGSILCQKVGTRFQLVHHIVINIRWL